MVFSSHSGYKQVRLAPPHPFLTKTLSSHSLLCSVSVFGCSDILLLWPREHDRALSLTLGLMCTSTLMCTSLPLVTLAKSAELLTYKQLKKGVSLEKHNLIKINIKGEYERWEGKQFLTLKYFIWRSDWLDLPNPTDSHNIQFLTWKLFQRWQKKAEYFLMESSFIMCL